ncbi:ribosomal silencing factor RsfS [Rickettsiales bacterium]|nr:ribosomal silencing factor RsfS [Rickettsiales bacterium]
MEKIKELLQITQETLEKHKAQDISIIDLKDKSDIAKYFVICSASVEKQVISIARNLKKSLLQARYKNFTITGLEDGNWVAIDIREVVVHIFRTPVREYYQLEKLWN